MKRLKKSSPSTRPKKTGSRSAPGRPFDETILKQARRIAGRYRVVIEPAGKSGFIGWSIEMPGVLADGETATTCTQATYEALELAVATLLELGQPPPVPRSKREKRTGQINIRVSASEKLILEEAAEQRGFEGISDFVRTSALRESRKTQAKA